ncbi:MAG TPA: MarR family transcriptional regulator [Roseomonas sp.]|nr:MarR family transcriptional regulator [Roseomonas sp.]
MPDTQPTLGFVLHDVARFLRKRFEQRARCLGLTRSQWQVLAFLAPNEGIHQGGLAELLEVEPITLARIIDRLEEHGLVERRQHPTDRRAWLLFLTERAHPMLERIQRMAERTRAEALEGISEAERTELMRLLLRMRKNLTTACDHPVEEAKHG